MQVIIIMSNFHNGAGSGGERQTFQIDVYHESYAPFIDRMQRFLEEQFDWKAIEQKLSADTQLRDAVMEMHSSIFVGYSESGTEYALVQKLRDINEWVQHQITDQRENLPMKELAKYVKICRIVLFDTKFSSNKKIFTPL